MLYKKSPATSRVIFGLFRLVFVQTVDQSWIWGRPWPTSVDIASNEVTSWTILGVLLSDRNFLQLFPSTLKAYSAHISTQIDLNWHVLDLLIFKKDVFVYILRFYVIFWKSNYWKSTIMHCPTVRYTFVPENLQSDS